MRTGRTPSEKSDQNKCAALKRRTDAGALFVRVWEEVRKEDTFRVDYDGPHSRGLQDPLRVKPDSFAQDFCAKCSDRPPDRLEADAILVSGRRAMA
jgi:hypothetical protein